jgi:hypothetical protein
LASPPPANKPDATAAHFWVERDPQMITAMQIRSAAPESMSCRVVEASWMRPKFTPVFIVYWKFKEAKPRGKTVTPSKSELVRKLRMSKALAMENARSITRIIKRFILFTPILTSRYPILRDR